MKMFRALEMDDAARVGLGVRILLASTAGVMGHTARRLSGLGGLVDVTSELFDALSMLIDDPQSAQMLVIDCDGYGGLPAGRRAFALLADHARYLPVVLITQDCPQQAISQTRAAPTILRASVTAVALRVAFDAAFRERRVLGAA